MFIYLVKHYISVRKLLSSGVFIISYVNIFFILPLLVSHIIIFCCLSRIKIFFYFLNSLFHVFINLKSKFCIIFWVLSFLFPQPFTYSFHFFLLSSGLYICHSSLLLTYPQTISHLLTLSVKTLTFLPLPSLFCSHSEIQSRSSLQAKISYKNVAKSI